MTTTFALLCERCGLSQREAADYLDMRYDTVAKYCQGTRTPPAGALTELRTLYAKIERAAAEALDQINRIIAETGAEPEIIELGLSRTDAEARKLGWPCIGAHAAALGLAQAKIGTAARIVPRGETDATAAAAKTS